MILYLNSLSLKIFLSGMKKVVVPVSFVLPTSLTEVVGFPLLYSWAKILPSLLISTLKEEDKALTTDIPTP